MTGSVDQPAARAAAREGALTATVPEADGRDRPSRRQALTIATTGMAAETFVSIAISIGWRHNTQEWWIFVIAESIGLPFMIAGLVGWWKRPSNRVGLLMVIVGTVWYVHNLQESTNHILSAVGYWLFYINLPMFRHLILAFPTGRLTRPFDRWLVITGYVGDLSLQGIRYLRERSLGKIGPWHDMAVKSRLGDILSILSIVLTVLMICSVIQRWRAANDAARRPYAPVWLVITLLGIVVIANIAASILRLAPDVQLILILFYGIVFAASPLAFLIGLLRVRLAFQGVAGLVLELQHSPSPARLRGLLGDTLGDPGLTLGFWSAESREYVDAQGQRIIPPTSDAARTATFVESAGQPIAVLVYDPALAEQQVLVKAVVAVARSTLENARLQAAQMADIQASRARIAEDALDDRRKIERDLHDGVQGRLLWLMHLAEQARAAAGDNPERPELAEQLNELTAEIRITHTVLRDLAQGIHPAILNTKGLAAAVEELALRTAVPVRVGLPTHRWPPAIQATAFFVISEALNNVVKHAQAKQVVVRGCEQDGRLVVEIADDGIGGADPESHGLRGMRDRVNALGGELDLHSPAGQGTRIILELPCV